MGKKKWEPSIIWNDPNGCIQIQRIGEGYRLKLDLEARAQTYRERRDRLQTISACAHDLRRALDNAGPECLAELLDVGRTPAPEDWPGEETNLWSITQLTQRPIKIISDEHPEVLPMLSLRLSALEFLVSIALEKNGMNSKGGAGVKPFNHGEPSPNLWLVNQCWTLFSRTGQVPATSDHGPFARFVVFVVQKALGGDPWPDTRLKNEIQEVVRIRNQFEPLWRQFQEMYQGVQGRVDSRLVALAEEIANASLNSSGLVKVPNEVRGVLARAGLNLSKTY